MLASDSVQAATSPAIALSETAPISDTTSGSDTAAKPSESSIEVTVLFFASARDATGTAETSLRLEKGTTLASVCELLLASYPKLASVLVSAAVAVNQEYIEETDCVIPAGAEIAVIPPVSGG